MNRKKLIPFLLVMCLMAGMLTPFAASDIDPKWKAMRLDSTKNNHQHAKSSFAASMEYIYKNF